MTSRSAKLVGNNAVEFVITTQRVADAAESYRMRISGIRVNAAAVGAGNPITATVTTTQLVLFRDTATVARTKAGLVSKRIGYVTSTGTVNEPVEGLACAASKKISVAPRNGDDQDITINDIEIKEGFATAFQSNTGLPSTAGSTNDVRIMLSFNDIPAGVGVHLRPSPDCSTAAGGTGTDEAPLTLTLKNGLDGNGAGVGSDAVADDEDDNYVQVSLSGGAGHCGLRDRHPPAMAAEGSINAIFPSPLFGGVGWNWVPAR